MSLFSRYIGIDYSGAQTPTASLSGLRIYAANGRDTPAEVLPPPSPRRYWTRREVAEWLTEALRGTSPALVGIDHGFSFPAAYFDKHGLPRTWDSFLDDFCAHWPTHEDHTYVDFVRDGVCGNGAVRAGDTRWRRVTELRARTAKSVFHFDCQGSVAKSTHAGIPWLRQIRAALGKAVHFWPFDGWDIPVGVHVMAEVYPALWRGYFRVQGLTPDQQDAYAACRWLQDKDLSGDLNSLFKPALEPQETTVAAIEGWILGVP